MRRLRPPGAQSGTRYAMEQDGQRYLDVNPGGSGQFDFAPSEELTAECRAGTCDLSFTINAIHPRDTDVSVLVRSARASRTGMRRTRAGWHASSRRRRRPSDGRTAARRARRCPRRRRGDGGAARARLARGVRRRDARRLPRGADDCRARGDVVPQRDRAGAGASRAGDPGGGGGSAGARILRRRPRARRRRARPRRAVRSTSDPPAWGRGAGRALLAAATSGWTRATEFDPVGRRRQPARATAIRAGGVVADGGAKTEDFGGTGVRHCRYRWQPR